MADASNNNANGATPTGEEAIRLAVENSKGSDESSDDDSDDDTDDGDDSNDDDSSGDAGDDADDDGDDSDDDSKDDKKAPSKSDRKFTQFAGDGSDKAYLSNLEKGYLNSSAEALKLKDEIDTAKAQLDNILRVAAANPEVAKAIAAADSSVKVPVSGASDPAESNPFIRSAQAEWQERSEKEIQEFIDANPEIATDPKISEDVRRYMKLFSNEQFERTGKLMTGGEAMENAFKFLGLEDKREKQNLAAGAKGIMSQPRARGNKAGKSGKQKSEFTLDQIAMAARMGKDEAWLRSSLNK